MRLTLKTSFIFFLVVLGLMSAVAVFSVRRELADYERETKSKLVAVGEALASLHAAVAQTQGDAAAAAALARFEAADPSMRVTWTRGTDEPALDHVATTVDSKTLGRGVMTVSIPIRTTAGARGAITLSEQLDEEGAIVNAIVREEVILAVLLLGALTALSVFVGALMVGRPVKELVEHARRVAQGELDARVELRGNDELTDLAAEMNEMCAELQGLHDRLRHADRLRTVGELASGIAHELGTPLNVVSGRAKLIAKGRLSAEEVEASAQIIVNQTDRIVGTIRQLLNFARRDTSHRETVELSALARRVQTMLAPLAKKDGCAIAIERDDDVTAYGNAAELEQALANLIVNGLHASPPDSEIVVRLGRDREWAKIEVEDHGSGIAPEDQPHVFEPFFTTKGAGEGTGLGLSIVAEIVRDHGGSIALRTAVAKGTTFTMRLPTAQSI